MPRITDTPEAQDKAADFIMMTTLSAYLEPVWGEGEAAEDIVNWVIRPLHGPSPLLWPMTLEVRHLEVALKKAYELGGMDMREEMYQTRGV